MVFEITFVYKILCKTICHFSRAIEIEVISFIIGICLPVDPNLFNFRICIQKIYAFLLRKPADPVSIDAL